MTLHYLDEDVKADAVAEILRVLRAGGRLHLVDVGVDTTGKLSISQSQGSMIAPKGAVSAPANPLDHHVLITG
jgi:hypothetical protein